MDKKDRIKNRSEIMSKSHNRNKQIKAFRKKTFENMTPSHRRANKMVRKIAVKYFGFKMKVEKVYVPYILDIYIPSIRVGIEIDGGVHDRQFGYDNRRDQFLFDQYGIRMFRFTNAQVHDGDFFKESVWAICYEGMKAIIHKANNKADDLGIYVPREMQDIESEWTSEKTFRTVVVEDRKAQGKKRLCADYLPGSNR
jgi:very-short-patch-repair endonuclease